MLDAEWFGRATGTDAAGWLAVLVSPFVGSFLGVVVRRLPEGRPIAWERSRCEDCGAVLGVRDLVPLFSWLAGRGRCRFCKVRLGWFYPGVELAALAIAIIAAIVDSGTDIWLDCALGWWLLALGWIDARHWLLPDALTLPLVIAGLGAALAFDPGGLTDRALGAAIGYLALRLVALLYRKFRGRDGLGEGDAKLLAAAGSLGGRERPAASRPDRGAGGARCRRRRAPCRRSPQRDFGVAVWTLSGARDLARLAAAGALG